MKRIYNHKHDMNDIRDFKFHKMVIQKPKIAIPNKFSLLNLCPLPDVLDQGNLGSCTANAASNALKYLLTKNKKQVFQPSRLFIYWFTRLLQNTVNEDSGASNRDTLKSILKNGACDENRWIYDITKYKLRPNQIAIREGNIHRTGFQYLSVIQDINVIKNSIYQGFPIILGISIYSSFESLAVMTTGNVPMPDIRKEIFLGGHAIWMVSYDDTTRRFGFMNSWGSGWGNKGFFTLPYDYVLNPTLAYDFWTVKFFN